MLLRCKTLGPPMSQLGHKRPKGPCLLQVRSTPNCGHSTGTTGRSPSCHEQTHAVQQTTCTGCADLLDHLIGAGKQRGGTSTPSALAVNKVPSGR